MNEIWKEVLGYEGLYEVSNLGRVKSLNYKGHKGKRGFLTPFKDSSGHLNVKLYKKGVGCHRGVHFLMAQVFIPNPENKPEVHHIDGKPQNNRIENLKWVTPQEHMLLHNEEGTRNKKISEKLTNGKTSKKVAQYTFDLPCDLIRVFPSIHEAERQTGILKGDICRVCKGERKSAYGYQWSYWED